jgi:hypothetical protein
LGVVLLVSGGLPFGQSELEIALPAGKLELHNVKAEKVSYQGRAAVRVTDAAAADVDDAKRLAINPGTSLQDGAIEIVLSGDTTADAPAQARGFVGIAFRVSGAERISSASVFVPRTGGLKTSCSETIPRNTFRCRDPRGISCAPKVLGSMSRMWTWWRGSGQRKVRIQVSGTTGHFAGLKVSQ